MTGRNLLRTGVILMAGTDDCGLLHRHGTFFQNVNDERSSANVRKSSKPEPDAADLFNWAGLSDAVKACRSGSGSSPLPLPPGAQIKRRNQDTVDAIEQWNSKVIGKEALVKVAKEPHHGNQRGSISIKYNPHRAGAGKTELPACTMIDMGLFN